MGTSKRATLLLGEDHPDTARALVRLLGQDFHIVGVVPSGEGLIELSLQLQPDAIVSDIHLAGLDGIAAMRAIRDLQPTVPIVLVTGADDPAVQSAALAAGASAFLLKTQIDSLPVLLHQMLLPRLTPAIG